MSPMKPRTHLQRIRSPRDVSKAYEQDRMRDPVLAASKRFRNSARWQRFRDWFKRRHPICCDPLERHTHFGTTEITEQVHHIVAVSVQPDLALTEANCAPLCSSCHNKVGGLERRGKATAHLFEKWQQYLAERETQRNG